MSLARNLSKFKPSSSGLIETADIADDAVTNAKVGDDMAVGKLITKITANNDANATNGASKPTKSTVYDHAAANTVDNTDYGV